MDISSTVGITEPDNEFSYTVYPVPARKGEAMTIQFDAAVEGRMNISVYDISGKQVFSENYQNHAATSSQQINPVLAKGTYILKVSTNYIEREKKFIVN